MANAEHLALVRSGVEALNAFAREHEDVALDLTDAALRGLDLRNARLHSADMRGCDLRGADLRGANMHKALLTGADLRGARFARLGVGSQRMCIGPASFEDVRWERDELERILEMINLNPDWQVRYEIVPRKQD